LLAEVLPLMEAEFCCIFASGPLCAYPSIEQVDLWRVMTCVEGAGDDLSRHSCVCCHTHLLHGGGVPIQNVKCVLFHQVLRQPRTSMCQ
jgi:hypothetical protein